MKIFEQGPNKNQKSVLGKLVWWICVKSFRKGRVGASGKQKALEGLICVA